VFVAGLSQNECLVCIAVPALTHAAIPRVRDAIERMTEWSSWATSTTKQRMYFFPKVIYSTTTPVSVRKFF